MAMLAAAAPLIASAGTATGAITAGSTLATLANVAQIGGTILSGIGAVNSLKSGNAQARAIADAAAVSAGQERAKSQYAAIEQRRQASLVASRARAVAGASGGGVTDPTVTGILTDIGSEGEYRALSAMYEGEDRARGIIDQGNADAYSAKSQGRAGFMSGISTAMAGAGSLFSKYAPTGLSPGQTGITAAGKPFKYYGQKFGPFLPRTG